MRLKESPNVFVSWCIVDSNPNIIHLGCMARARRPFVELTKLAKTPGKSHQAVEFFQKLYAIEKSAREANYTPEQRFNLRLESKRLNKHQIGRAHV